MIGKNTLEYNTKGKDILPGRERTAAALSHLRMRIAGGGWTQRKANLMIGLISMAWGSSFLMMKVGLDGIEPFFITVWRFGIAFFVLALLFRKNVLHVDRKTLGYAAILGGILFVVFGLLMYGMKTTTASEAGFLFGCTVVVVPLFQMIITRKAPQIHIAAGAVLAMLGVALLTLENSLHMNSGSFLCLLSAVLYSLHIVLTNVFTRQVSGLVLGIWQIGFTFLFSLFAGLLYETPAMPQTSTQWVAILGLALLCSAFGFVMHPIAQKYTTPEHTGIIMSLQPVFAAVFAFLFLQEVLPVKGYVGGVLVLLSVFVASSAGEGKRAPLKENAGLNTAKSYKL
mgnify:CR=1 FL=1